MTSTILDVVDAYFHRDPEHNVLALNDREIEDLGQAVHTYYENASFAQTPGAVYLGGWHSGWHSLMQENARETLSSLLYYDSIVIHDPLADYFRQGMPRLPVLKPIRERRRKYTISTPIEGWARAYSWGEDRAAPDLVRHRLSKILHRLETIRPAIEAGIVLPRTVWPAVESKAHELAASMRADIRDPGMQSVLSELVQENDPPLSWDDIRGFAITPDSGIFPGDEALVGQAPFLYLAKSIAIAQTTGSRYAPYTSPDFRLFAAKVEQAISKTAGRVSGEVIHSIGGLLLPEVDLPVKELLKIRQNESAFDSWRAEMRTMNREMGHLKAGDLREAVADALTPAIHRVDTALSQGSYLERSKRGATKVAITAIASAATANALNLEPIETTLVSTGPALLLGLLEMLAPSKPEASSEVLWTLRKSTHTRAGL